MLFTLFTQDAANYIGVTPILFLKIKKAPLQGAQFLTLKKTLLYYKEANADVFFSAFLKSKRVGRLNNDSNEILYRSVLCTLTCFEKIP